MAGDEPTGPIGVRATYSERIMEWKPIETAPKDGTHILVYSKEDGVVWVSWDTEEIYYPNCKPEKCWVVPRSHQDEQGGCYRIDDATHWMHVPEAPK